MKTPMKSGKFVAYYRVSTDRQGQSGLGLEAQKKAVLDYLNGGKWQLVGEFVEVESGKKSNRVELTKALATCKQHGATLVIAKLDRLSRNVAFVSNLMESGVEFVACDNPHATKFIIHILAAVAEHEREQISARTTAALAAAKRRGVKLGTHGATLARENKAAAEARARELAPVVAELRATGIESVRAITEALNARGIKSPRGARWHVPAVFRMLKLIDRQRRQARRKVAAKQPPAVAA